MSSASQRDLQSTTGGISKDAAVDNAASPSRKSSSSSSSLTFASLSPATREPAFIIPCILCTLVLLAVNIAYTQTRYGRQSEAADREGLLPRLSSFIILTTNEMTASTTFLLQRNRSLTDREQVFPLTRQQEATLVALQELQTFYGTHYPWNTASASTSTPTRTENARDPYWALSFSALRTMQYNVQQRGVVANDVIAFYDSMRLNALELMGHFAAQEVPKGSRLLYGSIRAAFMKTRNALDRVAAAQTEGLAEASVSSLTAASRSRFDDVFLERQLSPLLEDDPACYALGKSALSLTRTMSALRDSYTKTGTWDVQVGGPYTPTETLNNLTNVLLRIKDRYEAANSVSQNGDTNNYRGIVLASTVIGALVAVLAAVLWRAVQAVIQEAHDAMETTQMHALEASHQRMVRFLTSIGTMNVAGVTSTEGRNIQTVERDVYTLEQPTKQLVSFLHPALPILRQQSNRDGRLLVTAGSGNVGSNNMGAVDGGCITSPVHKGASPRSQRGDGADDGENMTVFPGGVATTADGEKTALVSSCDDDLIPRKLRSIAVSLVVIDLEGWQGRVTSESAKVVPREYTRFVARVTQVIQQHHGMVHETSAAKMLAAWNLCDDCHETESLACQTVLALHKTLSTDYPSLRFAVVTGECSVGVVGSDSLKAFACVGPILPLAGLLLKLNRVHNTVCVVDDTTFAKLDGQTFRTRPLEVIAVDVHSRRSVAFELFTSASPSDKDGRNASWNEAFDEYKSGNMERAKYLLRKWQSSFGDTRSITRLLHLITEEPPRLCTFKHNDDGLLEDELM